MLPYQVAYRLPRPGDTMVVAEVLDFPGVMSQGFDLADARVMVASALEDMAQLYLEQGRALPVPAEELIHDATADVIERIRMR